MRHRLAGAFFAAWILCGIPGAALALLLEMEGRPQLRPRDALALTACIALVAFCAYLAGAHDGLAERFREHEQRALAALEAERRRFAAALETAWPFLDQGAAPETNRGPSAPTSDRDQAPSD